MRLKSPATMKRYGTVLRCYDNGGKTYDRYTIVPPKHANEYRYADGRSRRLFTCIGCSRDPFYPLGIGMIATAMPGPHLGKRVRWDDLPKDVQAFARDVFPEYAPQRSDA